MKKFLGLLLASTLALGACGNNTDKKQENKTESVNENKTQFKNDTLVIDDAVLTIKDTFLVNDKNSDKKLLAFKYEVKNKTDKEEITPFNAWLATMQAKQDSDSTVNDLEVGFTPNTGKYEEWFEHSDDQIKKGKSAKGIVTYTLQNDEDVTLKASKGVDGKELGSKTIKLSDLKTVDYDATADITNESNDENKSENKSEDESVSQSSSENESTSTQDTVASNKAQQENNQSVSTNNSTTKEQGTSSKQETSNDYMNETEIAEWNKSKPTTHDESQMQGVGGHPSAFDPSIPKETQGVPKTDSNGEEYIDATGE
ncbi:putative lipoprotein [Staphylococcus xylosus]|uniref:DUF5067 domain-containing protein n=1 Tax=Staphylococcus xylosus TaxID=1288 RepID=UPI00085C2250|nr:DUF5067 domain-containing protein [Staphylococcus xylosus]SCU31310.1 putative lipoprotein [Staphylococcus xylosus]